MLLKRISSIWLIVCIKEFNEILIILLFLFLTFYSIQERLNDPNFNDFCPIALSCQVFDKIKMSENVGKNDEIQPMMEAAKLTFTNEP